MKKTIVRALIAFLCLFALLLPMAGCGGKEEEEKPDPPSPVLIESQSDQFDITQDMATLMLWQNMYRSAYYEYYYMQWGLTEDPNDVVDTYKNSGGAVAYCVDIASYYTNYLLHTGIQDMTEYLCKLVAGADAALSAGLSLGAVDDASIQEYTIWIEKIGNACGYSNTNKFLSQCVAGSVTTADVNDAARLLTMYDKYCSYLKYELESDCTDEELLQWIEQNPSGFYEIKYHQFSGADENFMKKLYEKLGKEWTTLTIPGEDAEKAIAETLTGIDAETLRSAIIEVIIEDNQKSLVLNPYIVKKDAETDQKTLDAAIATRNETELSNTLTALGITKGIYTTDSEGINGEVKQWILHSDRRAQEHTIIVSEESVYLVYIFATPTLPTTTVEAGWKEYKHEDYRYEDCLTDEILSFFGADGLLFADLNAGKKLDATKEFKSSEELAEEFFDRIKENPSVWDSLADKTIDVIIEKPEEKSYNSGGLVTIAPSGSSGSITTGDGKVYYYIPNGSATQESESISPFQKALFADGVTLAVGDFHKVDDNGTSYVMKITWVSEDWKFCRIDYVTLKDSDYHALYRALSDIFNQSYKASQTLVHPEKSNPGSLNEWLCAGAYNAETGKRDFVRLEHDMAVLPIAEEKTADVTYDIYIVAEPMQRTEAVDSTVQGGCVGFSKQEDAEAAQQSLSGLTGFDLWHAFSILEGDLSAPSGKISSSSVTLQPISTNNNSTIAGSLGGSAVILTPITPDSKFDDMIYVSPVEPQGCDSFFSWISSFFASLFPGQCSSVQVAPMREQNYEEQNATATVKAYASAGYVQSTFDNSMASIQSLGGNSKNSLKSISEMFRKQDFSSNELCTWFFEESRQEGDVSLLKIDGTYYLNYYHSSSLEWQRRAKEGWIADRVTDMLETHIQNGGYAMNEENFAQIPVTSEDEQEAHFRNAS